MHDRAAAAHRDAASVAPSLGVAAYHNNVARQHDDKAAFSRSRVR